MGLFSKRRPRVDRLQRKSDVDGLCEALRYHDRVRDGDGEMVDLGRSIRLDAMSALREVDAERSVICAQEALEDDDEKVQLEAARTLRQHASAELLIDCLVASPARLPEAVRAELYQALLDLDDPSLAVSFTEQLMRHGDDAPRTDDERSFLAELVSRCSASYRKLVADIAVAALARPEEAPQERAFMILSCVGEAGVEALEKALDQPQRAQAARALGALKAASALPGLLDLLDDAEAPVRASAARALGEIRDPRAVEGLLKGSTDPEYMVREASNEALDGLGVSAVVFALATFLPPLLAEAASERATPSVDAAEEDELVIAQSEDSDSRPPEPDVTVDAVPAISSGARPEAPFEWLLRAARRIRARR